MGNDSGKLLWNRTGSVSGHWYPFSGQSSFDGGTQSLYMYRQTTVLRAFDSNNASTYYYSSNLSSGWNTPYSTGKGFDIFRNNSTLADKGFYLATTPVEYQETCPWWLEIMQVPDISNMSVTAGNGLMTKEGLDVYGLQVSYEEEDGQWGASLAYALEETSETAETTYWGLNGYWTPEDVGGIPSISVGYEVGNPSGSSNDTTHWFLGFQWDEVGDGTLGAAFGTKAHTADNATEYLMYEAFYSYPINDAITFTPVIFLKETAAGSDDETGVVVKTSFSF